MRDPVVVLPSSTAVDISPDIKLGTVDLSPGRAQFAQCQVLTLSGECDLSHHLRLRALLASPAVLGARALVVDMSRLTFIDAGCLGLLLNASPTPKVVVGASGAVARVLDLLDCNHRLARVHSLDGSEPAIVRFGEAWYAALVLGWSQEVDGWWASVHWWPPSGAGIRGTFPETDVLPGNRTT